MHQFHRHVQVGYGAEAGSNATLPAQVDGYQWLEAPAPRVGITASSFVSVSPTDKLSKVDSLHVIPALGSNLPVRVYASPPLTQLPLSLFGFLLTTVQRHVYPAGTQLVDPKANRREYLAVLDGELETCGENVAPDGTEEIQIGRLMNSASTHAIILLHTVPRRTSVRAVTPVRILQLDSARVEALLAWLLRCDIRRKPTLCRS